MSAVFADGAAPQLLVLGIGAAIVALPAVAGLIWGGYWLVRRYVRRADRPDVPDTPA